MNSLSQFQMTTPALLFERIKVGPYTEFPADDGRVETRRGRPEGSVLVFYTFSAKSRSDWALDSPFRGGPSVVPKAMHNA